MLLCPISKHSKNIDNTDVTIKNFFFPRGTYHLRINPLHFLLIHARLVSKFATPTSTYLEQRI